MIKFKFFLILLISLTLISKVEALDIQYGSIKSKTKKEMLIEYYGIENKIDYLCSIISLNCSETKKTTLGIVNKPVFKASIKKELTENKASHATLSKNSKYLAYYLAPKKPDNIRTYVVKNTALNKNYTIQSSVSYWDLINDQRTVFEFSPDEKFLIYTDDKDDQMSLYRINLESLNNSKLKSEKINLSGYIIGTFMMFDSQTLYYIANTKDNPYIWSLYELNLETGSDKIISNYVSYLNPIIKIDSRLFYISFQEKGYGPEIYNTKTKKISYFKIPNIKNQKNIKDEQFFKVGESNAVIMTPPDYNANKSYPVLIWLHGGPLRQTSLGYHPYHSYGIYDSILKLLQKNNVIVLKLDYRGSFGVGRLYSEKISGSVGQGDIADVLEAVSYAKNNYNVKNVYLAGNSYGGYMSLKAIVDYPELFKGVLSINGVTDWESLLVSMRTSIFNTQFNGLPNNDNKKLYNQASIVNNINSLDKQRIEIIHGGSDRTIPFWQAVLLTGKLKDAEKNVTLTSYKGEGHVFKYKKNIGNICVRLFDLIEIPNDKECTN